MIAMVLAVYLFLSGARAYGLLSVRSIMLGYVSALDVTILLKTPGMSDVFGADQAVFFRSLHDLIVPTK